MLILASANTVLILGPRLAAIGANRANDLILDVKNQKFLLFRDPANFSHPTSWQRVGTETVGGSGLGLLSPTWEKPSF